MTRVYPNSRAIFATLAYRNEQQFGGAVGANAEDLDGLAVVERPRHGPAGDGHAHQLALLDRSDRELTAHGRQAVPVVLGDEGVGLLDVDRNCLHRLCNSLGLPFSELPL
jgi:hypothetical protein